MIKCNECRFWVEPDKYTKEEETATRRQMIRAGAAAEAPLPEKPGSCHYNPPKLEIIPTPAGPLTLTVWPSTAASDPKSTCRLGEPLTEEERAARKQVAEEADGRDRARLEANGDGSSALEGGGGGVHGGGGRIIVSA